MKLSRKIRSSVSFGVCIAAITTLILAGCGGGGSATSNSPPASTLGGVAAVGTPIVNGNISVVCAAGSALATTTNATTGAWSVTLSGQTLPCAVEVSIGTINGVNNTTLYHSIATATGTVNVTPLTELMVANLAGSANPGIWFAGLSSTPTPLSAITQTRVNASLVKLSAALNALSQLGTHNPITTAFTPVAGNVNDDMLTALATAIANSGVTYSALLSNASVTAFNAPVTGFNTALATAYAGTTSGATTGGTNSSNPGITGVLFSSTTPGSLVTITGTNFAAGVNMISGSNYLVSFNGTTATPSARTLTQLAVLIPTGATTGPLTVTDLTTNQVYTVPGGFTVAGSAAPLVFHAIPANGIFTAQANNVTVDFVDIVGAVVTVNSTDIIVDITLRNLPATFTFNQPNAPLNYVEYEWGVDFGINNDNVADYSLSLSHYKSSDGPGSLISTPAVGPLVNGTNSLIIPQVNVWKDSNNNNSYLVDASASITGNTLRLSVHKSASPDLANITSSARVRIKSFYRSDSTTTYSDSI